jgi:hypothetical protein
MSVNDRAAASRQFVASSPPLSALMTGKRSGMTVWVVMVAAMAALYVGHAKPWSLGVAAAIFFLIPLAWFGYLWRRSRRSVVIGVTSEGLTVNQRPGDVFSLIDPHLGPWVGKGVALHLQSGSHGFVLGGRDRRIAPSTRLDAPPVQAVDAWLYDSEFDELLAMGGGRSGVDVRGPAPGESTRCLLFPNPYLAEEFGSFAFRKHLRHMRSQGQPSLVLDVDDDAIQVIDPNGDALNASASRAQVTATPAVFRPDSVTSGDGSTYNYPAITGLVVRVPGVQPVTIGCLDMVGSRFRFSWRGDVSRHSERPAYVVSGADWLTLAEKFGLASYLEDQRQPPTTDAPATPPPMSDNRYQEGTTLIRPSRDNDRPRLLTILGLLVISLALFAVATFLVWNQHFGAPARVTVDSCSDRGADSVDVPINNCYAHPSGAPKGSVIISGALSSDVGHDVEVHRTGEFAIKDTWWEPLLLLGLGCAAGVSAVRAIVRRLRRGLPNTSDPGRG